MRMPVLYVLGTTSMATVTAALAGDGPTVSQVGKAFSPNSVTVASGQALTIVNDDDDVVHHAYVDEPGFKFDSGDQDPDARTRLVLPDGTHVVLCGVHPKMRLVVTVGRR